MELKSFLGLPLIVEGVPKASLSERVRTSLDDPAAPDGLNSIRLFLRVIDDDDNDEEEPFLLLLLLVIGLLVIVEVVEEGSCLGLWLWLRAVEWVRAVEDFLEVRWNDTDDDTRP